MRNGWDLHEEILGRVHDAAMARASEVVLDNVAEVPVEQVASVISGAVADAIERTISNALSNDYTLLALALVHIGEDEIRNRVMSGFMDELGDYEFDIAQEIIDYDIKYGE